MIPADKLAHFVIGAIVAGLCGAVAQVLGLGPGGVAACAIVGSVGIGVMRELIQASFLTGTADAMDALATAAGGLLATAAMLGFVL